MERAMSYRSIAILMLLVSCAPAQQGTAPGQMSEYRALVDQLKSRGIRVVEAETIEQPFLTRQARVVRANDDDIQVYEYETPEAAEADAKSVSPSGGTIGTTTMHWMAPPHFHRRGRLIAIHIGGDAKVREALVAILGPQFAGQ